MADPVLGTRLFVDGLERDVFLAPDGRQYVLDDGEKVFGVWLMEAEADEPVVVPFGPI